MYNRYSADTIIVIIVFFEKLAQQARTLRTIPRFLLQHPFKHTVGENFPGGIWEARRKRELSCQGNTALRGFPGQRQRQPVGISRRISDERRKRYLARGIFLWNVKKKISRHPHKVTRYNYFLENIEAISPKLFDRKKIIKFVHSLKMDKFKSKRS